MDIYLYNYNCEKNRLDKTGPGILTQIGSKLTGDLIPNTSIIDPEIIVTASSISGSGGINYLRALSPLNRYYFIRRMDWIGNNAWKLYCHVDVLTTYKTRILTQTGIISRYENSTDSAQADPMVVTQATNTVNYLEILSPNAAGNPLKSADFLFTFITLGGQSSGYSETGQPTSGFNIYAASGSLIDIMLEGVSSTNVLQALSTWFANPAEGILGIRVFPLKYADFVDTAVGQGSRMTFEDVTVGSTALSGPEYPQMYHMKFNTVDYTITGGFHINTSYGDWRDYDQRFTRFSLYMPYIGSVDLDPAIWDGRYIKIIYTIDMYSGSLTVKLYRATQPDGAYFFISSYNGQIGFPVPYSGINGQEIVKNVAKLAVGVGTGVVTSAATGMTGGIVSAGKQTAEFGLNFETPTFSASSSSNFDALFDYKGFMIRRTKLDSFYPSTLAHDYGKPFHSSATLSALTGYVQVDKIHLIGFTDALEDERQEIENALRGGIVI